jgi:hypothetical protein
MQTPHNNLPLRHTRKCALWKGSILELATTAGCLTPELILKRINQLKVCDDRTKNEENLLQALQLDYLEHPGSEH